MKLKNLFIAILLVVTSNAIGQIITGKVSAPDGPLPGANISVKGKTIGSVSDFDGNYSISKVTDGDIIVFSYLGYVTQEVIYTGQKTINITLAEDAFSLDEVVLVNYGTQKNTSVSVVKAEDLNEFPTADLGQALQGRAAGVNITNAGSPGSQTLIQIRGVNTFGDGQPLFVVDGVFTNSINSLDLNSVEKVDVLKDAASLAVYGSRGTNGVIIITTKKGRAGKTKFSFQASSGIQEFYRRYDLLNTEQHIQFLREVNALVGQNGGPDFPIATINDNPQFNGNGIDTDWQDAYFQQAPMHSISGNVNGGSENAKYNLGFSHLQQEGVFIDTGFERTTLNLNTDGKVTDWMEVGQTLSMAYSETISPEFEGGRDPLQNIIGQAPYIPVIAENGLFGGASGDDLNDSRNQIRVQDNQDNLTRISTIIGSVFAKFKLAEGLTFRSQFGIDGSLLLRDIQIRAFQESGERFENPINFIRKDRQTSLQTVFSNSLSYNRTFGKHTVNLSAAAEQLKIRLESASISDNNQITSQIPEAFSPNARATSFNFPENLNSLVFLGSYEYDNKYSLSTSGRRDTSSRFSPENASDWFFSVGAGWNVTNESFFDVEAINSLKLRASYGETGNNRTGTNGNSVNQFLPSLGATFPVSLGDETSAGISPNRAVNPNLRWETQIKQNYGLNLGLLNDQIQFSVDYFKNTSEDLIVPLTLFPSAGIPGQSANGVEVITNAGIVDVDGFEFTLGYNDYEGDFKWNFWGNVTTARNIVRSVGPGRDVLPRATLSPPFAVPLNRLTPGEAPFHFFGFVADGVFSTQEQIDTELPNNANAGTPIQPGDVRFVDLNGDGLINLDDRAVIGDPNPDFTYSVNLRAEYKGFDVNILFNGVQGVDAFNSNIYYLEGLDNGFNYGTRVLRRWQNPGDITDIPRFRFGDNRNNAVSSRYIEDASYLRLRNATIGYTFADDIINKSGNGFIKKLRIYFQGQNLLTLTNYTGLDPEIAPFYNAAGLVDGLGIDRSAQPRPVTILSGIQIEF